MIVLVSENNADSNLLNACPTGVAKRSIEITDEKPGYLTINIELLKDKLQ